MLAQTFSAADLMMIAIVFFGTVAMMLTGGLSVRSRRDEPETPEPEKAAETERERILRRYRSKWGSSDAEESGR